VLDNANRALTVLSTQRRETISIPDGFHGYDCCCCRCVAFFFFFGIEGKARQGKERKQEAVVLQKPWAGDEVGVGVLAIPSE
jgi:hypothetical protein